jgi:hypothetical protein
MGEQDNALKLGIANSSIVRKDQRMQNWVWQLDKISLPLTEN